MIEDLGDLPPGMVRETDVAIVGGGAAGISAARELQRLGVDVTLLEAGGLEFDQDTQNRFAGELDIPDAQSYAPLEGIRLRYLGGTTNHWGGWCRPLDDDAFSQRAWVGDVGWPFGADHLLPWQRRAHQVCELGTFAYDLEEIVAETQRASMIVADDVLTTPVWRRSPPTRFGERYRTELREGSVQTWLHANVVGMEYVGSRVNRIAVRGEDGSDRFISPRVVILAAGGLESIRLMLLAANEPGSPITDTSGWLGRGWMEHPHALAGHAVISAEPEGLHFFAGFRPHGGADVRAGVGFQPDFLAEERLAQYSITFDPFDASMIRDIPHGAGAASLMQAIQRDRGGATIVRLLARTEQRPDQQSRVELTREQDDLGMPRLRLRWRLADDDLDDIARGTELMAHQLAERGVAIVRSAAHSGSGLDPVGGGYHHLGGLRMHESETLGVVDPDCRAHGLDNLYIASGAVFPTAGAANPTMTIVALTLRLVDHLAETVL